MVPALAAFSAPLFSPLEHAGDQADQADEGGGLEPFRGQRGQDAGRCARRLKVVAQHAAAKPEQRPDLHEQLRVGWNREECRKVFICCLRLGRFRHQGVFSSMLIRTTNSRKSGRSTKLR